MPEKNDTALEYEVLLTPQLDALLRTARRLTRDLNDAEDLVQEAVLKGLRFFDRFEPGSNFKAWIFRILMNAFVNSYRRRRRQSATMDMEQAQDVIAQPPTTDPTRELSLRDREEAVLELVDDRIRQALDELPEQLRIVFMLNVLEDLKYREIAEILECPVGTVMSRLFRARAMLKDRLVHFAAEHRRNGG